MYGIGYEKSDVKSKRIGKGYKAITSDPHFQKEQEIFEHNLGKYAYGHEDAIRAVDEGLAKMRKVLVTYYKDKYSNIKDQAEREAQICLDAFTNTDDPTSAGQVGKIKYKQLCEIIESNIPQGDKEINSQVDKVTGMAGASNLREKMTAFYNAAYYKGYKDKNPEENITNFKNIAQKIAVGGQSELVNELDLDSSILEEQKKTSTNPKKAGLVRALYNTGAGHKVMGFFGKIARIFNKDFDKDKQFSNRMHTQDVYDMALISLDQKSMGAKLDNIRSGSNLRYRGEEEQKEVQRSLDYYNNMGLNLSERERNYILETVSAQYLTSHPAPEKSKDETTETFNRRIKDHAVRYSVYMDKVRKKVDPDYTPEESLEKEIYEQFANDDELIKEVEKTKSPIKEGIVYKDIPKKGGFLKDIMVDKHNVRIVNGISMTTARMLKTYKWLNLKSNLMNFRLALMGWMLPTDDHSLWEIIIGSHNVGVKGKEDLTDIVSLDQTVDPLSQNDLRDNVCSTDVGFEPMFPHEIVYWRQRYGQTEDDGYRKVKPRSVTEDIVRSKEGDLFDVGDEKDIREGVEIAEQIYGPDEELKARCNHSVQKSAVLTYTSNDFKRINLATNMVSSRGIVSKVNNIFFKEAFKEAKESEKAKNYVGYVSPKELKNRTKKSGEDYEEACKYYLNDPTSIDWIKEKYKSKIKNAKKEDNKEKREKMIRDAKKEYKKEVQDYKKDYKEHFDDCIAEANVIYDSLAGVEKRFKGKVYTGTWKLKAKNYKPGTVEKIKMFKSSSKSIVTAKGFIGGFGGLSGIKEHTCDNVLQEVELKGKYGIDLTSEGVGKSLDENKYAMSVYDNNEMEVLNMPGAKWKVTEVYNDVPLMSYGTKTPDANMARNILQGAVGKILKEEYEQKITSKEAGSEIKALYRAQKVGTLVKMEEV